MRKSLFLSVSACLLLTSCSTTNLLEKTATTARTETTVKAVTIADLDVSPERVSYTMRPSEELQRGGEDNVRRAAESEVLAANGNADVLVDAQFVITKESGSLFKSGKITSVTVTGHPARYKNFRPIPESVWENTITAINTVGTPRANPLDNQRKKFEVGYNPVQHLSYPRGFGGYFSVFGGKVFTESQYDHDNNWMAGASLTLGVRMNPHLFVGVGAAGKYQFKTEFVRLPVFADIHYYVLNKKITPFVALQGGYSFILNDNLDHDYVSAKGGIYASPIIGLALGHFEIGAQYTYHRTTIKNEYNSDNDKDFDEHHVGLSLGLRF